MIEQYINSGVKLEQFSSHLQIIDVEKELVGSNLKVKLSDGFISINAVVSTGHSTFGYGVVNMF